MKRISTHFFDIFLLKLWNGCELTIMEARAENTCIDLNIAKELCNKVHDAPVYRPVVFRQELFISVTTSKAELFSGFSISDEL